MRRNHDKEKYMPVEKRWLTAAEMSQYLNLNIKSLYRAGHLRKLPYAKVPGVGIRYDKKAIDDLLERESITPRDYGRLIKE